MAAGVSRNLIMYCCNFFKNNSFSPSDKNSPTINNCGVRDLAAELTEELTEELAEELAEELTAEPRADNEEDASFGTGTNVGGLDLPNNQLRRMETTLSKTCNVLQCETMCPKMRKYCCR